MTQFSHLNSEATESLQALAEMAEATEMAELSEENGGGEAPEAAALDAAAYAMPPAEEDEDGELPVDFDRLWKAAHDSPQEFSNWTDLLQYCEQEVRRTEGTDRLSALDLCLNP